MEEDELALSDVHIDSNLDHRIECSSLLKYPSFTTRFAFYRKQDCHSRRRESACCQRSKGESSTALQHDEDGDLIVARRNIVQLEIISIEHTLSTHLTDVGLQVWLGCLYLCDFITDNHQIFQNATVAELGAGVGLASIVASIYAHKVFCTDVGVELLDVVSRNVAANKAFSSLYSGCSEDDSVTNVCIKKLDWTSAELEKDEHPFGWNVEDEDQLYSANILMAADVIYSNDLTNAFFRTVQRLMLQKVAEKRLIISVEKRLNFTLEHLDVACPAYTHFRKCVEDLCDATFDGGVKFTANLVMDVPQYFKYDRNKYLELWCIHMHR